jgi:hypothetical protein
LDGSMKYEVQAIELTENEVVNMLVLSTREIQEQHDRLIGDVTETAKAEAEAMDPIIRDAVLRHCRDLGIICSPDDVEKEVAKRKQEKVAERVADYETNSLEGDLKAAKRDAASFELSPPEFGRLQMAGLLKLDKLLLVKYKDPEHYYYRDHYVPEEEPTTEARLADNLRNKPKYRNTSTGRVFL